MTEWTAADEAAYQAEAARLDAERCDAGLPRKHELGSWIKALASTVGFPVGTLSVAGYQMWKRHQELEASRKEPAR